jgi:hypothetical protein
MTQTAVAWIIHNIVDDQIGRAKSMTEWLEIFDKAKAMEKAQMIEYSKNCIEYVFNIEITESSIEEHYNKTYGRTTTTTKDDR